MKIFLVGGFLGSGKTTAIAQAIDCLREDGQRGGVVTNDQGDQLVDTQFLGREGNGVREVTGGCFCCRYDDLDASIRALEEEFRPDVIFAESVGSCTDLVATVVRPLLHFHGGKLEPVLSVFADIRLLLLYLRGMAGDAAGAMAFTGNVQYIFEKQLEEATILVVNKTDLLSEEELKWAKPLIEAAYAGKRIVYMSALSKESVGDWIRFLFQYEEAASGEAGNEDAGNEETGSEDVGGEDAGGRDAGSEWQGTERGNRNKKNTFTIDYDRYGAGEAELAWLDGELGIQAKGRNAIGAGLRIVEEIHARIRERGYPVGHLKFLLSDGEWQRKIGFTAVEDPDRDTLRNLPGPGDFETERVLLLVNARVQTDPVTLREVVLEAILAVEAAEGCRITEGRWSGFQPGYPRPTHRMQEG